MVKSLITLILLVPFVNFGQDTLVPLSINPYLEDQFVTKSGNSLDSTFQYNYANLELPVFDDFSLNRWVNYTTDFSGPNVTSTLFYCLYNGATPISPSQGLCDSNCTYQKTIIVTGGNVVDSTRSNLTTGFPVLVNNLDQFPITGQNITLYNECYVLIDTIFDGVLDLDQDTIYKTPNFVQDSARIFTADLTNSEIWLDDFACHNYRFAKDPKSLGVATFDGVSNDGFPYDFGVSNAYGRADVLTSKPINLAGKSNVYLSFLYQAKGNGNSPEAEDSLLLEMYSPTQDIWYSIWEESGDIVDDEWRTYHAEISASAFLADGFQFRFVNKATTSGALDHWHIDYVHLRENSSLDDTLIDDIAISYPITSLIEDYTSVPWDHYNNLTSPASKMVGEYELLVINSSTTAKLTNAGQLEIDGSSFTLPVASNNWNVGQNVYPFNVGAQPYSFDQNNAVDKARYNVKVNIATSSTNQLTENDTTYFTQKFLNYYAYDDGSAESGYGILDNNAQIAYKFEAYEADTLTGILMKFVPNVNDVSNNVILITIWEDSSGFPGKVIYKDDFFKPHYPSQDGIKNQFTYFRFNDNQTVPVPATFFVGFEQIDDDNVFLGYDVNTNSQNKIFYNSSGIWVNSSFQGSLIMRPVFSTALNYTLSVQPVMPEKIKFSMYPNPVSNVLTIEGLPYGYNVKVYDITGKQILNQNRNKIDFSNFGEGFYIVNVLDEMGSLVYSQKIVKQ